MGTPSLINLLKHEDSGSEKDEFIACVRSEDSAERLRKALADYGDRTSIKVNDNVAAASSADVIVLGHKPYMLKGVLSQDCMADALRGKKIISILAGITNQQVREVLDSVSSGQKIDCEITRAMPNMGARVGESMTLITESNESSPELLELTTAMFDKVGRTRLIAEPIFDAVTVLNGACYAMTSVALDGLLDGGVKEGLPRQAGLEIAAQCFTGLAKMLLAGHHPAQLRESISSPAGATITGLLALERRGVRSALCPPTPKVD